MKTDLRRFAPVGLYLSLLGLILAAGLAIVQRQMTIYLQISLALIPAGLAIYALLDPDRVRQALTGRQARYGSNALVLSIAFVGILLVISYLALNNTRRWDMTEDKNYTLTTETLQTLQQLKAPVVAHAFFTSQTPSDNAKTMLEQYKQSSGGKFDYQFIDPVANPVAAEQAKITRDGTIVLVMGQNQEPVINASEEELTGGLVRLMNPEKRAVYFLTGNGEKNLDDTGDVGYSLVKRSLESKNYTVKSLNLLTDNKIPEDAKVIVVAGPSKPMSAAEIELLQAYLQSGNGLVTLLEPPVTTDTTNTPDPLIDYLAKSWGVVAGNDIVVDPTSRQPFAPYAAQYGTSPITEKISTISSQFPTARSMVITSTVEQGISPVALVMTAQQAWGETDTANLKDPNSNVSFDPATDIPGPVPLAVQAQNFTNQARLVAFGDSDYAINANFPVGANGDLIVNSIDWAAGQEQLINLTPKNQTTRTLVPPQVIYMNLMLLVMVIVLPALALLAGVVVWLRRRGRG